MDLEQFITTHITSVDELRALLLLQASAVIAWDAVEAGGKLYLPAPTVEPILAGLVTKGLLVADEAGKYRYQPASPELGQLVAQLAEMDRVRPVTLINLIYTRSHRLQAFSDAFKLKRDKGK